MRFARWIGALGLMVGVSASCEGSDNPEIHKPPGSPDGASGNGGSGGTSDGSTADSGPNDAAEEFVLPEASSVAVRAGIVPVASTEADAAPSSANETLAHLDVIAAGARAATVIRRWDDLYTSATLPDAPRWQYLEGVSALYADAGRNLLVSLAVVDRTLDARPNGLANGWSSPATINAGRALLDRTFATFGSELTYLALGNEVDRFLAQADATERGAFVDFAKNLIGYAKAHPAAPAGLRVGVSASFDGLVQPSSALSELLGQSDVAIASYHALDASFQARPASSAPADLDALWNAVASDGGVDEVVFQEVAYPSASQNGSSLQQQSAFFDGLFVALLSRRERFPFVVVRGSNEASPAECEAHADALGASGSAEAIAAYCSFGLRTAEGDGKPAWAVVVDGLATFSSP